MTPEIFSTMGRRAYKDIEKIILEKSGFATVERYKENVNLGEIIEDFYDVLQEYNDKLPPFPALFLDASALMFVKCVGKTKGIDNPKKYLEEIGPLKTSELALEYAAEDENRKGDSQ